MVQKFQDKDFYNNGFDLIRYWAAISVMLGHFAWRAQAFTNTPIKAMDTMVSIMHFFPGVVLLFAISGFLVTASLERSKSKKEYMLKRVVRLYPELWVCTIVNLIMLCIVVPNLLDKSIIVWLGTQVFGVANTPSISVRDTRTQSAYQALTDKEIGVHVDPTFLIDLRKYAVKPKLDKYLLVYTYSFDADKIKRTKEFAKQKGLKIVAVGNKFDWCDFSLPASPFEVLGLFMNAEYVVTDTFHGTALSIHFHRQFCTFADGKEKILELIKEFHLEHRNACRYGTLSEMEQVPVDYEKVSEELKEKRDKSQQYLRGFIS